MGKRTSSKRSARTATVSDPARTTLEIVTLVAETKGCRPTELEPLSYVTDPDALSALLRETSGAEFRVEFEYEGGRVSISSDSTIEFVPPSAQPAASDDAPTASTPCPGAAGNCDGPERGRR